MNRETAERCTILRGLVGSTVHGLNVNDGIEDRDEMGVCVEPLEDAIARLGSEQFIYRSAAEREGRDNARSTAGDLDLTIYSLRKWTRLAVKGNPTIMLLLFTPEDQLVYCDGAGRAPATIATCSERLAVSGDLLLCTVAPSIAARFPFSFDSEAVAMPEARRLRRPVTLDFSHVGRPTP